MTFRPSSNLSEQQVQSGLSYFIKEGLAAEAMSTFTSGTFLVAMAVLLNASNFQIGLLAALPILTNVFQLVSIWLVQKFKNRKAISVTCSFLARVPLFIIGLLPLVFAKGTNMNIILFFLFFQYLFASISGASWNSWIKDLVPDRILGSYFSRKAKNTQVLNVVLSLLMATVVDYIHLHLPQFELFAYGVMFVVGGVIGMVGVYLLAKVPEPETMLEDQKLAVLMIKPLKDVNFRNLLTFHACYAFATGLALPFFVVYMMKTIGLSFAWIIALGLIAKFGSIVSLKFWGAFSDKYSNKTIISICAPVFVICILSWTFVSMTHHHTVSLVLLAIIHLVSGIAAAGVDLAISNTAIKLAPKNEAISYISARNMIVAVFAAAAPMAGGLMADFFATHQLSWNVQWQGPSGISTFHLLELKNWNFFFIISAILSFLSLRLVSRIKEQGEGERKMVAVVMRKSVQREFRKNVSKEAFRERIKKPVFIPAIRRRMNSYRISRELKKSA